MPVSTLGGRCRRKQQNSSASRSVFPPRQDKLPLKAPCGVTTSGTAAAAPGEQFISTACAAASLAPRRRRCRCLTPCTAGCRLELMLCSPTQAWWEHCTATRLVTRRRQQQDLSCSWGQQQQHLCTLMAQLASGSTHPADPADHVCLQPAPRGCCWFGVPFWLLSMQSLLGCSTLS